MLYPFDKFVYIGEFIINNMESGYYHPDMYYKGAKVAYTKMTYPPKAFAVYSGSGETLFGLDRFAGHDLFYSTTRKGTTPWNDLVYIYNGSYKFKTKDAEIFWTTLDKLDARNKWPYNYFGEPNRDKLKALCYKMLYTYFLSDVWSKLSDTSKQLILKDDQLAANYIYTCWNGSGWVQKFNRIINDSVKNNITDTTIINNKLFDNRQASKYALVRKNGKKLQKLIPQKIKKTNTNTTVIVKKKTEKNLLLGGLVSILIVIILFRKKIFK